MILSMLCLNRSLKKIFAKGVQKIIMEILQSATTKLNNKIELYGEDKQDNNVLVIGVFHGDEPQGKYLIEKYIYSPSPAFQASSPQWASENFRRSEPQAKNRLIVQIIMVRRQAQPALCKNSNLPNQQLSAY